ncbi:MAG: glycoside hydrolase family 28 protein, partial [Clostridia bacterium]|nr:glycoside hydrolase family 28 protein [Clostridia bacterium]
ITIKNPSNSPNTDGINPESCSNVHISNSTIDVGDDCLTLKSGTEDDELQKAHACENIVVTNCTMMSGHGGVVIGSEMSGGVKNVTISNCVFNGTDRGIRIKTRRKRGGFIEDVIISNIVMTDVIVPFVVNGYYQCGAGVDFNDMSLFSLGKRDVEDNTPVIKNINISNIRAKNVIASAGYIYAIPEMPVEGLTVTNYSVEMTDFDGEIKDKPIMAPFVQKTRGEGFFAANVKNSIFRDVAISVKNGCGMEFIGAENVRVAGASFEGTNEPIRITDGSDVKISD